MQSRLLHAVCLLPAMALAATPARSAPPSVAPPVVSRPGIAAASAQLIESAAAWDGRDVLFSGEAIGEPLARGTHAWLQLNDDAYQSRRSVEEAPRRGGYNRGLAVWAPLELARRVGTFGGYRREGDSVQVAGTFNAACREHGGDMDIHAASLEILRRGHEVSHRLDARRLVLGLALLSLSGILVLVRRAARRLRRTPETGPG